MHIISIIYKIFRFYTSVKTVGAISAVVVGTRSIVLLPVASCAGTGMDWFATEPSPSGSSVSSSPGTARLLRKRLIPPPLSPSGKSPAACSHQYVNM